MNLNLEKIKADFGELPILCFLCKKDITEKVKVISYFSFPDKLWNEMEKDWVHTFRQFFNRALCSDCAKKDFDANLMSLSKENKRLKLEIEKLKNEH